MNFYTYYIIIFVYFMMNVHKNVLTTRVCYFYFFYQKFLKVIILCKQTLLWDRYGKIEYVTIRTLDTIPRALPLLKA